MNALECFLIIVEVKTLYVKMLQKFAVNQMNCILHMLENQSLMSNQVVFQICSKVDNTKIEVPVRYCLGAIPKIGTV